METLPWFAVEQVRLEMDWRLAYLRMFRLQRLRTFRLDDTMTMNDN